VVEGLLAVDFNSQERVLGPEDGGVCIPTWVNHRLYPPSLPSNDDRCSSNTVRFLLSGQMTQDMYKLDTVFFENWYNYQDQVVIKGEKIDLIQVICASQYVYIALNVPPSHWAKSLLIFFQIFDAGGSYLSLPWWVPFSRSFSRALGIIVGRWLGGLLGYQPFYRKWNVTRAGVIPEVV